MMRGNRIFIILQLLILLCSNVNITNLWTYLSLINLIFFIVYNYKLNFYTLLKFNLVIGLALLNTIGVFLVETNEIYLIELQKYSFFKNSFPELVFLQLYFFSTLLISREKKQIKRYNNSIFYKFLLCLILVYSVYFLCIGIKNPYFYLGLDRFRYKEFVLSKIERELIGEYLVVMIINIYIFFYIKTKKIYKFIIIISSSFLIIALFLMGNKFGEFLWIGSYYLCLTLPIYERKIKTILSKLYIMACIFILILFLHKKYEYENKINKPYKILYFKEYMYQRLAQQGQLWWGTYDKKYKGELNEFFREFSGKKKYKENLPAKEQEGIWKIMLLNAPEKLIIQKAKKLSVYTASTNASINYYFGFLGNLFFLSLFVKIYIKIIEFFNNNEKNKILTILYFYVAVKLNIRFMQIFFMSHFGLIFDIKTFIYVSILLSFLLKIKINNKE